MQEVSKLKYTELSIKGAYIIELEPHQDNRGFYSREFCKKELFEKTGINFEICQTDISYNKKKGTIRGMHFLKAPYEEMKIVSCTKGAVYDVVLDLRRDSETYLKWQGFELNEENRKMLLLPIGTAHGFQTLLDDSVLNYKMSQYYMPNVDGGVRYNDPLINIDFPIKSGISISERDTLHPNWIR